MTPTFDLKREHDAMLIILASMKKISQDIFENKPVDLFRIGQIIEFLETFNIHCHHEKEEQLLFPVMLECDVCRTTDLVQLLSREHETANSYLKDIYSLLNEYLTGYSHSLEKIGRYFLKYILMEENHTLIENTVLFPLAEKTLDHNKLDSLYYNFRIKDNILIGKVKNLEYFVLLKKLYNESNESTPLNTRDSSRTEHRYYVS